MKQVLRDLIYFDFEKAASIFSQIEGGLLLETQSGLEGKKDKQKVHKLNLAGIYKPEFGGISEEKTSLLESRKLHHDLLVRIEEELSKLDIIVDLNAKFDETDVSADLIRSELDKASYIRAEGWASIEDYTMLRKILINFNNIMDYTSRCAITNSDEFKDLQSQLRLSKEEASNGVKKAKSDIKRIESDLQRLVENAQSTKPTLEEWFIEGFNLFVDTLMPERINFRICPFETTPQFQITGNLKRECFFDSDLENIIFAYGIQPNVKLTVFGLITSKPPKDQSEFKIPTVGGDIENLIQEVFNSTIGIHKLVRHSRYPSITIYPIAMYHSIYEPIKPE